MHLGLVIYGSLDIVSGGYLYDRKLVEHLERQGDRLEIISLPWRNYPRHLVDNFSRPLLSRLEQAGFDALLQDELNHPSLFWLNRRLKGRIDYPLITIVHHLRCSELRPAWQNRLYALAEQRYLSSVDGYIFNSQTTRRSVAHSGIDVEAVPNIVAYPAGDRLAPQIDEKEISQRALHPGPLRLFFLGNLIPRKGLHTLLNALERLPAESWSLSVAGGMQMDRAYTRAILEQIAVKRMSDRVRLHGVLDNEALAAQMRASHVLVVPSTYEGFGIAYLEGMGFGLPAIATSAGAANEIITSGLDGYLVPPEEPDSLASCLAELTSDRQRLIAMSLAARRRYLSHPTWEQSGQHIREFLISLAG